MNATVLEPRPFHIADISTLPTRIQDIPKHILQMYGIIVDGDELSTCTSTVVTATASVGTVSTDDEDDDVLVIDEDYQSTKPAQKPTKTPEIPVLTIQIVPSKPTHLNSLSNFKADHNVKTTIAATPASQNERRLPDLNLLQCKEAALSEIMFNCPLCKMQVSELSFVEHKKRHCFHPGCMDLILDDVDLARHKKMHEHPTKPFLCRFCKKRYRFYGNVAKHHKICKMLNGRVTRNRAIAPKPAKERGKRATTTNLPNALSSQPASATNRCLPGQVSKYK